MSPDLLPAIASFARVAHHASFTRAAAELGISASALSQTMRTLEAKLGVRLLDRTTRRVGVTELGQRFLADAQPALAALAGAVAGIDELRDKPTGLLRLNLSSIAARVLLLAHLGAFMAAYPDITLEIRCENRFVDLVAEGFDAGIRLGESVALDMIAVPLGGPQRLTTFAAPSYLKERPAPHVPADLREHRCMNVRMESSGAIYRWEYQQDGQLFDVETSGALVSNDTSLLLAAVLAGEGIGCEFESSVRGDFESGRLVPVLERWWPTFPGFYLYYPSRAQMPRKLRVFIDFMQPRIAAAEASRSPPASPRRRR